MEFGVCGGPDAARVAREAGYDYFEWSVGDFLHPREPESAFLAALAEMKAVGLPCPASNIFIPADLKITGETVDRPALETFVRTALSRAEQAGVQVIVFGSGGARRIPEGFDRDRAWEQLISFCSWMGQLAAQHGVTIAVEPLNKGETNVINTVDEGAALVRVVDQPNIRLLVDGYHWAKEGDTVEAIHQNAPLLAHAHVATLDGRRPPRTGDDCAVFFAALKAAGYNGRVSIEGNITSPETELPEAIQVMSSNWM